MHSKYRILISALAALFFAGALNAGGKKIGELGGNAVSIDDESKLALMMGRLIDGLKQGKPALYMNFLADEYREFATGKLAKSGANEIAGKSAFWQRIRSNRASEIIDIQLGRIEFSDDESHAFLGIERSASETVETLELRLRNTREGWRIVSSNGLSGIAYESDAPFFAKAKNEFAASGGHVLTANFSTDSKTFEEVALSEKHGVRSLSKRVTKDRLGRELFRMPHGTAFYSSIEELNSAPFLRSSYVQLVTDPGWNRIIYGDYERFLKAYDGSETDAPLNRPYGIAADAQGLVYVADAGNGRIVVLKLTGFEHDLALNFLGEIGKDQLVQPKEIAWDDRGTIDDRTDDLLWVIDQPTKSIYAFRTDFEEPEIVVEYRDETLLAPSAIAVGRFDGRGDGLIYVADNGADQLHQFFFDGDVLQESGQMKLPDAAFITSLATDHWGNVFMADRGQKAILKISPALEMLGMFSPQDRDFKPARLQTLFSQIRQKDEAAERTGYNHAFLLEDWTENSGGRRLHLGIDVEIAPVALSQELDELIFNGTLTDPGELTLSLLSEKSESENFQIKKWLGAGRFDLAWNRDDEEIAPGFYTLRAAVASTYGEAREIVLEEPFYIPLYIYEDCGSPSAPHNRLVRGAAHENGATAATATVVTDGNEVVYRFTGLNPNVSYETRLTYFAGSAPVEQEAFATHLSLHAPMVIGHVAQRTAWLAIPSESVQDGVLELRIRKTSGQGLASVAEIWLREAAFDAASPPAPGVEASAPPEEFALNQNYPNPFNPSTSIRFGIPGNWRGRVSLRIFNMMGQLVRELVNEDLAPGNYTRIWRGRDNAGRQVASGVYVYRLRAGDFTASNKMLMMK